jgi:hypothetical protein
VKETAILIPSDGRANGILTKISGAVLYVPESQADEYRINNPDSIIEVHPDNAHKNLAEKRQDIYQRWGCVFMVDDDIIHVVRLFIDGNTRKHNLTPDEIHELIQRTAHQAALADCYLYGFNNTPNAKHYYPHKPINLTSYINACAFGLHPSERLYFTNKTTAAESHWINLLNAATHRKCWADMRYSFVQAPNSTFYRHGGQTAKRTLQTELEDTLFLRKMFGKAIRAKRNRKDAAKIHQYQRTIHNPL